MSTRLPPAFLSPEDRSTRRKELEQRLAREWLRYAVLEGTVIGIPILCFLFVYAYTDAISKSALIPVGTAGACVWAAFLGYSLRWRIRPIQRELSDFRKLDPLDD
jgi:hypothetical protein